MRLKATKNGMVPFTTAEEAEADARAEISLESRLEALKEYRKQIEFGGFTFNGERLGSDKEDQRKIAGAALGVMLNPSAVINFKAPPYTQIAPETMLEIGTALFNHVQACHTREMELITALESDINTDITTGWPE